MSLQIFIIGLLAAIAPGPDFFIVMKNSLGYGKKIGIASALGIGSALLIHATYTILGLALVIQRHSYVFKSIQLLGAAYLAYLGIQAIRSTLSGTESSLEEMHAVEGTKTVLQGFQNGFLCNILNPKAFLFFLSIFSQFLHPDMPHWVAWGYGLEIACTVSGWFVFLSVMISSAVFRRVYQKAHCWVERFFGVLLLFFAATICRSVFGA